MPLGRSGTSTGYIRYTTEFHLLLDIPSGIPQNLSIQSPNVDAMKLISRPNRLNPFSSLTK